MQASIHNQKVPFPSSWPLPSESAGGKRLDRGLLPDSLDVRISIRARVPEPLARGGFVRTQSAEDTAGQTTASADGITGPARCEVVWHADGYSKLIDSQQYAVGDVELRRVIGGRDGCGGADGEYRCEEEFHCGWS